jgi:alanyl-tRNA synthetase
VRRIEAICGLEALKAYQRDRDELARVAATLTARPGEVTSRITALAEENKRLSRELQQARMKAAMGSGATGEDDAIDVAGVTLVARQVAGMDKEGLRALVDKQRDRIKSGVVVLACPSDDKVSIVVGVTADLTKKVPAGEVVKLLAPIVGGRGGGRPDFAEAGGKDATKIPALLAASRTLVEKMLSS